MYDVGIDRKPQQRYGSCEMERRPLDSATVSTNPPGFHWLPNYPWLPEPKGYTLQYSKDKSFKRDATTISDLKLTVYAPHVKFSPGRWYWRYNFVFDHGMSRWSAAWAFIVPENAVELVLPPIEEVVRQIPKDHPRIFVRHENLDKFRALRQSTHKKLWDSWLSKILDEAMKRELPSEPEPYPNDDIYARMNNRAHIRDSKFSVLSSEFTHFMVNILKVQRACRDMEVLALGYLTSGNPVYAEEAKKRLLNICSWDPNGTTRATYGIYSFEDEISMAIFSVLGRTYDWIYETLTPDERRCVQEVARIRGEEWYNLYMQMRYDVMPYRSHPTRNLAFLGEMALSFLGDFVEAKKWLDYVLTIFFTIYPPWGGDEGGWSEGIHATHRYMMWAHLFFLDILKAATGIDLWKKTFFRNTGYFKLYFHPPHSKRSGPFCDGQELGPLSYDAFMKRMASVYVNGYYKWYSEVSAVSFSNRPRHKATDGTAFDMEQDPFVTISPSYLWHDEKVEEKIPADLPPSRAFMDVGWVALHTNLSNEKENISFFIKSSPYGGLSHSHASQNCFEIHAFGEPLAISSGYYFCHPIWLHSTQAHNCILVDGQGQEPYEGMVSGGKITQYFFSPSYDYILGDASKSYGGKLIRFQRHVVFVRPIYFIIYDELESPKPSTFQWLLHAINPMIVNEEMDEVTIIEGDASLLVLFLHPDSLKYTQTDQFPIPAEPGQPNQWHLTASTTKEATEMRFLTLLQPYKTCVSSQLYPYDKTINPYEKYERRERGALAYGWHATKIDTEDLFGVMVSIKDAIDTTLFRKSPSATIETEGFKSDASIISVRKDEFTDHPERFFVLNGSTLIVNRAKWFESSKPATISVDHRKDGVSVHVELKNLPRTLLTLRLKNTPKIILLNGKELAPEVWTYQENLLSMELQAGSHSIEVIYT